MNYLPVQLNDGESALEFLNGMYTIEPASILEDRDHAKEIASEKVLTN